MSALATKPARTLRALELAVLSIREGWTQGAYARTASGAACELGDGRGLQARRVDLAWALTAAATECGLDGERLRTLVRSRLPSAFRNDEAFGLERWNDQLWRTRSEVLALLHALIEELNNGG